jgi:erythromycin esterase-like protein
MANDGFTEVQRQLEATATELRTATDPARRRMLLREMSRLVAEAERISTQPPKMSHKPGKL